MLFSALLVFLLPLDTYAAETVLGVYLFSRHGDRTAKSTPPANLTDLGYRQIFTSGTYFRNRYIASTASSRIAGVNSDIVKQSQITASAPLDTVLMNSAQGFLQGLYPPVGPTLGSETLRNGSIVQAPLNGYQLIPIQTLTSGTGSENSAWLQGSSNCAQATVSSNDYFSTTDYNDLLASTGDFYKSLTPLLDNTFSPEEISFKNAYTIYDLLAVASIHNTSFPSSLLTPSTLSRLRTLAHRHEFSLAYNASAPIRAIAGSTLAAQILQSLTNTITSQGKTNKITIEFGAYASFLSFFGLANLTKAPGNGEDFYGIPDYASTMVFELFTASNAEAGDDGALTSFPAVEDLRVRFLFHNGTVDEGDTLVSYPLFGQLETALSWREFRDVMEGFAVGGQDEWCWVCGNSTGVCAQKALGAGTAIGGAEGKEGGGGVSRALAGVIGAMVTLAVVLAVEMGVMLGAGLRVMKKRKASVGGNDVEGRDSGEKI